MDRSLARKGSPPARRASRGAGRRAVAIVRTSTSGAGGSTHRWVGVRIRLGAPRGDSNDVIDARRRAHLVVNGLGVEAASPAPRHDDRQELM